MKTRSIIIPILFLMMTFPAIGDDAEKKEILKSLEFPQADLQFGYILNDPFFGLNILNNETSAADLKNTASVLEKDLNDKPAPELFYKLGNTYKDLKNYETSIRYYKKYLGLISRASGIEDSKTLSIIGETYYSLSVIDLKNERTDNLERCIVYLSKVSELDPENISNWIMLGDCYLTLDRTNDSLFCYNKVLMLNSKDFRIYSRLQAASFQADYLKLLKNRVDEKKNIQTAIQDYNFDYIQTAINNSTGEMKDSFKLQHYIYLLRLLLIKKESMIENSAMTGGDFKPSYTKDEESILSETEILLQQLKSRYTGNYRLAYLSGIVNYLKSDYKKALDDFKYALNEKINPELIHNDILFICLNFLKDGLLIKSHVDEIIKTNPKPEYYLILAGLEYKNLNFEKAEMLCNQSLKLSNCYPEAYSGIAVISALNGNYVAADEIIKKGNRFINENKLKNDRLINGMKVNEAAIALLKNEKERAYILLRSVLSVDNNEKASRLYNRYFIKK